MKILITGGAGFLGSHLADTFLQNGDEVFALDSGKDFKVAHNLGNPRFHYVYDSVMDAEILDSLSYKCDMIYHFAAVVGVEHYVGDPYHVLNVNINGTQNILKAAFKFNKKVIFASTSEVYGKSKAIPFQEDGERLLGSTKIDRWCYSTSKAAGEHFCFAYHKMGLPIVVLRYFNVYGPRLDTLDKGRVITIFLGQILRDEDVTIIGGGSQTRSFTYVSDAIRATFEAGINPKAISEVFNIGNSEEITILELAKCMIRVSGSRSKLKFVSMDSIYGKSYEDIPRRVPDVGKMEKILGLKAEVSLEDGMRQTVDWFRQNKALEVKMAK